MQKYITQNVIGNANNRRAMLGIEILEYLKEQEVKLNGSYESRNISSDIIESTFAKEVAKQAVWHNSFCPVYTVTRKLENKYATKSFNFKERLCNVKLKDIDVFAKEHMSINWVTERTKQLRKVG